MSAVHVPRRPKVDARALVLPSIIFTGLAILFVRLWYIQVVIGAELSRRAEKLSSTRTALPAPRGLIYDRNGKVIAGVQSQLVLTAKPGIVLKQPWVLKKVADLLETDVGKLERKTRDAAFRPYLPAPIYSDVPLDVAAKILEGGESLPGIGVETQSSRFYEDPVSFSHLLGYVWVPGPKDVDRAAKEQRRIAPVVGKGGIEWEYEGLLMGDEGYESILLDGKGRPSGVAERVQPSPGSRLTLTLDAELQKVAIKALGRYRGAVVALEPSTGEILCLASTPTYSLELFKNGISRADFTALSNNPDHPFINRPLGSAFAPGSTFKIVTTVAAMRQGIFDPNHTVVCNGGYRLGRQFFKCLGHHGQIAFDEALVRSCNTYFADLAMAVGKDGLRQTALDMGFFAKTGIDLAYERTGLIPTDEWLTQVKRKWVPGYTVQTGIGQGDVLATPLQMAELACMVANGGVTYKTHLLKEVSANGQTQAIDREVLRSVELDQSQWDRIRRAMIGVIDRGTAAGSRIPGLSWAGKTGSAEVAGQARTNSWFIGYAPAENPTIAICVMVEAVGHGSDFAAPVARQVVEKALGR